MPSHLAAFLSYAHLDDGHGKITGFRNALTVAVSQAFGEDFEIFQDRDSINWGQHWPKKIEQGLAGGRFLIAILSPSFFRSDNCRQEVARFLEIERAAGREDLILPVYFRTTPYLEDSAKRNGNPLAKSLALRQHRDWRELRNLPFTDEKVLNELDSLAEELVQALDRPAYVNGEDPSSKEPHISESRPSTPSYPGPGVEEASASSEFLARDPGRMWPNLKTLSPEFIDPGNERRASSKKRNLVEYEPGSVIQDIEESWCPKLVVIPPGDSIMGSPSDEEGHRESEEPRHLIHIERPFALGIYPVTFDEFDHFCLRTGRAKPGDQGWGRGRRPVINVNVLDAEAYLAWLS
ncbi:MAG: TIR domain-containing protein, partial [Geminicoccaceae bacterium]